MGGAGGAETTGETGRAPAIVGFVSFNWEYACISWRIAVLYWFKVIFWNRSGEDTGNAEVVGVPDAWVWTVAMGRAGGGMKDYNSKGLAK